MIYLISDTLALPRKTETKSKTETENEAETEVEAEAETETETETLNEEVLEEVEVGEVETGPAGGKYLQ